MVKIRGMSLLWTKFKLSIVDQINITKTYLLSQIRFFAPVIPFNETQLQTLRNEIGSSVRGNLKTTINKAYNAIQQGGLGMIEIKSYINAIRVGFFMKSINNDNFWAKEIQQYRISTDFRFHIKSSITTNIPCGELSVCVRTFCNCNYHNKGFTIPNHEVTTQGKSTILC